MTLTLFHFSFPFCINVCVCVCVRSVAQSCLTLVTSWTIAHQAPLSMGLSRQGYWSGLPFPPSGDRPYPGMETVSPASPSLVGGFFITKSPGKPLCILHIHLYPFICRRTFRMLPRLATVNSAAVNTEVQ